MTFSEWLEKKGYDESQLSAMQSEHLTAAWQHEEDNPELARLRDERPIGPFLSSPRPSGEMGDVLAASLAVSMGTPESALGGLFGDRVADQAVSRPMRGQSFHSIMRSVLGANGEHAPTGRFTDSDIRRVFELSRGSGGMQASAGLSTISLPGILGTAANKSALAGFEAVPATWPTFCAVRDLADFKPAKQYRLTGKGTFEQVGPAGEIKHGSLSETEFSLQADTFGKLITIDRRDLINDDMSMFARVPRVLGRMGALALDKAVYTALLANAGSPAFFSTTNKNKATGGGSALALAGLGDAYQLFQEQLDDNGEPTMISPQILLVAPNLEMTARGLVRDITIIDGTATAAQPSGNPFAEMFTPVSSPWLSEAVALHANADDASWYLLAGPGDFAVAQVGFLDGRRAPVIESGELDFDRLGLAMRSYWDFGVSLFEFRGGVLSVGS